MSKRNKKIMLRELTKRRLKGEEISPYWFTSEEEKRLHEHVNRMADKLKDRKND